MKLLIPIILLLHCVSILLFTHYCTDPENPGIWGLVYFLSDPLFFGLFGISFKKYYTDTFLNKNFISVWGFMNVGRLIAYSLNYMGIMGRNYNLQILVLLIAIGTFITIISALRHGIFKQQLNG